MILKYNISIFLKKKINDWLKWAMCFFIWYVPLKNKNKTENYILGYFFCTFFFYIYRKPQDKNMLVFYKVKSMIYDE